MTLSPPGPQYPPYPVYVRYRPMFPVAAWRYVLIYALPAIAGVATIVCAVIGGVIGSHATGDTDEAYALFQWAFVGALATLPLTIVGLVFAIAAFRRRRSGAVVTGFVLAIVAVAILGPLGALGGMLLLIESL